MWGRNRKSSLVFLALAEFAWLVVFGSVFLFLQTSTTLRTVREDLRANKTRLADETSRREKFEKENKDLRNVITNIDDSLLALNTLRTNYDQLLARGKHVEKDLAEKERLLVEARVQLLQIRQDLDRLQSANAELTKNNQFLLQTNRELLKLNLALAQRNHELERIHVASSNEVAALKGENEQFKRAVAADVSIRRELTGLPPGVLHNVVFVFDTSLSMRNSPAWADSVSLVRMWLEYLPVTECALVMFDDKIKPFPGNGGYQPIRDSQTSLVITNKQNELFQWFDRCKSGNTSDLYSALGHVYTNLPTAKHIIIFSDGKPEAVGDGPGGIGRHRAKVEELVALHKGIPITTVAVNSYMSDSALTRDKNTALGFLKFLARQTKGSFIGR